MQSQLFRSWKLGLTWMHTWQHILEVRLGARVESWVEQKARPNSQHKFQDFLHEIIKI